MRLLTGIFFIGGLFLAMSEGVFFPWLNIVGVGLFALAPVLADMCDGMRG
jgi:hypothetical protein